MKKTSLIILCIILTLFLSGCKKENEKNDENKWLEPVTGIITNDYIGGYLSDEEEQNIKEIYCDYYNNKTDSSVLVPEDVEIKYYLGKYEKAYVAIVEGDRKGIEFRYYGVLCGEHVYSFAYLPEMISVFYNGKFYTLQEICFLGVFNETDMKRIYHQYGKVFYDMYK